MAPRLPNCRPSFGGPPPKGPCVRGPGAAPFGGPASGLWPSGPLPGVPSPGPAPIPPPGPTCVTASIIADCFIGYSGMIDPGSPGPQNGWTWSNAFGLKGGQVSFSGDVMHMNSVANNNLPAATKDIVLLSVQDITAQYTFTEYAAPAGSGNSQYEFYVHTAGAAQIALIRLTDDGSVVVAVGPAGAADIYFGTWTPNNGTHKVHFTVDSSNVPLLYIDDVPAPLVFGVTGPVVVAIPGNTISFFMTSGPVFPDSSTVSKVALTSGVLPSSTDFCCP